jgi:hypothetical protein
MPVEEQCVPTAPQAGVCMQDSRQEPTRQRFLELTQLAVKACQELEAHGLKKDEYCLFGRIIEQVCRLK